jgi:hypothetical protein
MSWLRAARLVTVYGLKKMADAIGRSMEVDSHVHLRWHSGAWEHDAGTTTLYLVRDNGEAIAPRCTVGMSHTGPLVVVHEWTPDAGPQAWIVRADREVVDGTLGREWREAAEAYDRELQARVEAANEGHG